MRTQNNTNSVEIDYQDECVWTESAWSVNIISIHLFF